MNPNNNELYKKRMREVYEELNKNKYYKENGYITSNGRITTLGIFIAICSLGYITKKCHPDYNSEKIERVNKSNTNRINTYNLENILRK
jgi:hypothetical protein